MAGLRFAPSAELVLPRRKRGVPARRSDRFLRPESPSRASNKAPRPTPRTLLWLRLRIKTAAIQRVIPLAQERTCEVGAQESARKAESTEPVGEARGSRDFSHPRRSGAMAWGMDCEHALGGSDSTIGW